MTLRLVPPGSEPLRGLVSIAGPSSSGKTYSALRIATGMQEVLQCRIAMIDTELRGNLYQGRFEFDRYVMPPPFSPEAWIEAVQQLDGKYGIIISDNFSDEYEGPGGIAEMAANSKLTNDVAKWARPKAEHKALMSRIRLLKSQHIFLLRAADKIEVYEGEDKHGNKKKLVRALGWQPIAEKNFKYDITAGWMLPPDSRGKADVWKTIEGLPFRDGETLSEEHGRMIARWTRGEVQAAGLLKPAAEPQAEPPPTTDDDPLRIAGLSAREALQALEWGIERADAKEADRLWEIYKPRMQRLGEKAAPVVQKLGEMVAEKIAMADQPGLGLDGEAA